MPTAPSDGGRNLYALSQNANVYTRDIANFVQNTVTGEIGFTVTGVDPFFGIHTAANVAYDTTRGIKIPVKAGQSIAVHTTNEDLSRTYVSYFGIDNVTVKPFKFYNTNKFVVPTNELENVSYITLRFGLEYDNDDVGKAFSTKVKVEYGNVYTDWTPAPEDLGWSSAPLVPTQQQRYLWKFEYIYYSDGSVEVTQPVNLSIAGADADTTGVTDAINQTNQTVESLQSSVSQAQSDLATVSSNLTQARQNLESSIASVNTKAQAVETTLAQVQSTANANSQKTATLENDLDGLNAKFSSLRVGAVNLLKNSKGPFQPNNENPNNFDNWIPYVKTTAYLENGKQYTISAKTDGIFSSNHAPAVESDNVVLWLVNSRMTSNTVVSDANTGTTGTVFTWNNPTGDYLLRVNTYHREPDKSVWDVQIEQGNIATDYSPNEADIELKVAEYKQTSDQNYASLQSTVQALDGTVTANKATADQTAQGFSTRIESLETYKDGENTRANQYFEVAKTETARQLTAERTAIAKDYVAKSTYTSDVTGIRNDLTATTTTANTTKTNLANYQAANDQAVASLQSSLQTTDGNVSSLQTQINAVPGQITSAVSAVEGKIPKTAGGRNLIIRAQIQNGYIDNTGNLASTNSQFTTGFIDGADNKQFTITAPKLGDGYSCFRLIKYDADKTFLGRDIISYTQDTKTVKTINLADNVAYFKVSFDGVYREPFKVECGNIATDWSPAPEDTATQISNLSSQIQQTADGMTLLATKTELNSAKTELQSGITTATSKADNAQATANSNAQTISTHTTQISALNTGLQAKVSQSDFDSLSGRVTTAESNLTATANQLSSQISSVNERIPSGEMNLIEYGRPDDSYNRYGGVNYVRHDYYYNGNYRCYALPNSTTNEVTFSTNRFKVERNTNYTLYFKGFADSKVRDMDVHYLARVKGSTSGWDGGQQLAVRRKLSSEHAEDVAITFNSGNYDEAFIRLDNNATTTDGQNAVLYFGDLSLKKGKSNNGWSPSLAEIASARDLVTAKSEIKQTTDAITASVSSVQTAANNAQSTANTAVSKADTAQAGVNTLDSTTVKSASLNLDNNGFVTKVGKTIDGNKFATMIAQNANNVKIIADEMQVTANMIVDGAVTANKLNVNNLSAVNSNLGAIKGGSLLLQENKTAGSATDSWGTYNRPAYKQGLFLDNHAFASSGAIQRKSGSETTPTDMPLAVLQSGELRFLVVDYNDNLENVVHYGLSDPDFGAIRFEIDSELKRRLTMTSSGYLNFQASNYTDWIPLSQQGCEYMIQGRLVAVNYDVTFSQGGTYKIGDIPQEFVKKELMLTAKAWSITPNDKNFQLNADGGLHLLNADANVTYRGTLLFSY